VWTFVAVLMPAMAMPVLLALAPRGWGLPGFAPQTWPMPFWIMAIAGVVATVAGLLDWRFHRNGGRHVGKSEHRAELLAMSCGGPLFAMMATASVSGRPNLWLVPIVLASLVMAVLIAYDEVRFHRVCGRYETLLHRVLVGGHTIAFLAWLSWCMGRGNGHA
jgi:hypothetical protein